jgi:proton-coupled amino acid transporter
MARLGSPIPDEASSPGPRSFLGNTLNATSARLAQDESPNSSYSSQVLIDVENPNFQSDGRDAKTIQDLTSPYFNDQASGLTQEGGDITHNLKKTVRRETGQSVRKNRSLSDLLDGRRGSASALNVPGGFRREFIVTKARQKAILNDEQLKKVPFLTKNFMEFLYIYGHFAGEDFDDDFNWDHSGESEAVSFDENSPLIGQKPLIYEARGTTSTIKAFLIMLKAFVGTGILFLPKGFSNGGLSFSVLMLIVFGIYSYYCYYLLVVSKNAAKVSSFGDIGAKFCGPWMKKLITFSLILTQIGFAGAYIIFTTENLGAFVRNSTSLKFSAGAFFFLQTIIFIPLSFIRNVSKLSLTSLLANFFILSGLIIVLFFTANEIFYNGTKPIELFINESQFSLFIGTAIFAFEGIGLIIPIQDSMRHPEKFPMVLAMVLITITILMVLIATMGYLAYGEDIQTVILLNLPQTNFFVQLIQFFYSLAILLSTPLQIFPVIGLIEKLIFDKSSGKTNPRVKWFKNLLRTCIVLLTVNIAWFGASNLDKFVSFVGCFACIPLVYMYPPMMHLCGVARGWKGKFVDIALIVIGLCSMSYTSYQIIFG